MVETIFKAVGETIKGLLEQLFLTNPTAAAWAIAFFVMCYGMVKLALYTRGLQEKLDASGTARETAMQTQQQGFDTKIAAKDQEIAVLTEKFHEHAKVSINVFNTVNNTLKRTNGRAYLTQIHNGLFSLCIHQGMLPHQINMPVIDDSARADSSD